MDQHTRESRAMWGPDFHQRLNLGTVSVNVTNTGTVQSDVAVLAYVVPPDAGVDGNPLKYLIGFERINLKPGQSQVISFDVSALELSLVSKAGIREGRIGQWKIILHDFIELIKGM